MIENNSWQQYSTKKEKGFRCLIFVSFPGNTRDFLSSQISSLICDPRALIEKKASMIIVNISSSSSSSCLLLFLFHYLCLSSWHLIELKARHGNRREDRAFVLLLSAVPIICSLVKQKVKDRERERERKKEQRRRRGEGRWRTNDSTRKQTIIIIVLFVIHTHSDWVGGGGGGERKEEETPVIYQGNSTVTRNHLQQSSCRSSLARMKREKETRRHTERERESVAKYFIVWAS